MKNIKTFKELNESFGKKIMANEDINNIKGLLNRLSQSIDESKIMGKKGIVNPQKEFENVINNIKRIKNFFMELNIELLDVSQYFGKLYKSLNDIISVRDIRQATEIKSLIYKLYPLVLEDFKTFIVKKSKEISQ